MLVIDKQECKLNNHPLGEGVLIIEVSKSLSLSESGYGFMLKIFEIEPKENREYIGLENEGILSIGDLEIGITAVAEDILIANKIYHDLDILDKIEASVDVMPYQA